MTERETVARSTESADGRRRRWPGAASTPPSATGPLDYAVLEGAFALGLAGLIAMTRKSEADAPTAVPLGEIPLLALATFAFADVLAKEKISTWIREPFVEEGEDHKPVRPEGGGLRYAVGELMTCTRCVGTWSALGLVALRTASPTAGRATVRVLALAGANDLMQTSFRLLAERTNQVRVETEIARRPADGMSERS